MISNKRLEFIFKALCKRYELKPCILKFKSLKKELAGGILHPNLENETESIIIIDLDISDEEKITSIYHEFKHYWQMCKKRRAFLRHQEYFNFFSVYPNSPINFIEEDALMFGITRGKFSPDYLLASKMFELLESCEEPEEILKLCQLILERYPEEYRQIRDKKISRHLIENEILFGSILPH